MICFVYARSNDLHSDQTSKSGGCRADNTTTVDCNSRGTCLCGQCECNKRDNPEELVQGQFCECDNFSCDRSGGLLCSGPEHGECNCGQCTCLPGWSGNACDCSTSVEGCYPREGGEICSGHGDCECGVCKCKADDRGHFSGQYCEHCPTCQGKCTELRDCVQCLMYKKGPLAAEEGACASNCTHFTPTGVPTAPVVEKQHEHWCKFYDENDCIYEFVYTDESRFEKLKVRAMETPDCPPEVFVLGIVFGVIATIVMIGLALLFMWKVITSIHDRNEFAKFEKERDMAKWDTVSCVRCLRDGCGWELIRIILTTIPGRESDLPASNDDVQESHVCWQIRLHNTTHAFISSFDETVLGTRCL